MGSSGSSSSDVDSREAKMVVEEGGRGREGEWNSYKG